MGGETFLEKFDLQAGGAAQRGGDLRGFAACARGATVLGERMADHDHLGALLFSDGGDAIHVFIARFMHEDLQRAGDSAGRVANGQPDAHFTGIDGEDLHAE